MPGTVLDEQSISDFRPFHRTSSDTVWNRAFDMRDRCYDAIVEALGRLQIRALVTKSQNGQYPPHIRLEAWQPAAERFRHSDDDPRVRGELHLQFIAMPYHEHTIVTNAWTKVAGEEISITERPEFWQADAVEWALYAVGGRSAKPGSYRPFRDAIKAVLVSMVPFARGPHSNRIAKPYKDAFSISAPMLFGIGGLIVGFLAFSTFSTAYSNEGVFTALLLFLAAAALLITAVVVARRKHAVSVIDRPTIPPRYLIRVDGWHAVIPDLGAAGEDLRHKLITRLEAQRSAAIVAEVERYGYRTPNGFDERDRIVVSKEQSTAHIHLYQFGGDLFVGWDSYVNWACWKETGPISSRREGSKVVEYRSLTSDIYLPNQFDLIDVDSLTEVVHRHVTIVVKAAMEEHKIDQEIDFTIVRGDRDSALDKDRYDRQSKRDRHGLQAEKRRWRVS